MRYVRLLLLAVERGLVLARCRERGNGDRDECREGEGQDLAHGTTSKKDAGFPLR